MTVVREVNFNFEGNQKIMYGWGIGTATNNEA
jgi:hypothetical protein